MSDFDDDDFPAEIEILRAEVEALKSLSERLKLEAQSHAQEARTANATIAECYQAVTGGKGEPGRWHGAAPVRECIEALRADNARLSAFIAKIANLEYREAIDAARAAQGGK